MLGNSDADAITGQIPATSALIGSTTGTVQGRRASSSNTLSLILFACVVLLVGVALAAPWLAPHDPVRESLAQRMLPPQWVRGGSPTHPLGTDDYGRDVLSRLLYGARISLGISGLSVAIAGVIGGTAGMASGYIGGVFDTIVMRFVDILLAVPLILVAIAMAVALGPSGRNVVIAISALLWPRMARAVRGETLIVKVKDYVQYARAVGVPFWRIMFRHILPNVAPTFLVYLTLELGHVILLEATLGFLGAGIPPPAPSWGASVSDGAALISTGWWIALFPGCAIIFTVLVFNAFGDQLRDRFDPRLKTR